MPVFRECLDLPDLVASVVDPNTLNLDQDPAFWSNLYSDLDPGLSILKENLKIILEKFFFT